MEFRLASATRQQWDLRPGPSLLWASASSYGISGPYVSVLLMEMSLHKKFLFRFCQSLKGCEGSHTFEAVTAPQA